MEQIIKFYLLILLSFFFACKSNENVKELAGSSTVKISIPKTLNNVLQFDSIFLEVNALPLETNEKCLIGRITKTLFFQEKMFILDDLNKLFAFDTTGKFLYTVGKMGRGPGEYLELRDFDLDELGNIYILSYQEILKYSFEGTFLKAYLFNFENKVTHCNPMEFAIKSNGNFYLWGGSVGIKDNSDGSLYALYEINSGGKLINKYFPLKYETTQSFEKHRFSRYKDAFRIEPNYGVNSIYSLKDEVLQIVYEIDFGEKNIKYPIPEGFKSSAEFKIKVDQLFCHSIEAFIETDDWIYFRFLHKMKRYNVYFSKNLNKSFVSRFRYDNKITLPLLITSKLENKLIGFCDPQFYIDYIKDKSKVGNLITEGPIEIKPTDNPILLVCSLRKY